MTLHLSPNHPSPHMPPVDASLSSQIFVDMETISIYIVFMSKTPQAQIAVSRLKSHIGFWMRFVSNHVSQAFVRELEQSGVTVAEWVVMREMFGENQTSPSAVAGQIGMTRGAITKIVDRLLRKGLVTRRESSGDR